MSKFKNFVLFKEVTDLVRCNNCNNSKSCIEFHNDYRSGGFRQPCRECTNRKNSKRKDNYKSSFQVGTRIRAKQKQCPDCKKEGVGPLSACEFKIRNETVDGLEDYCKLHKPVRAGCFLSMRNGHAAPRLRIGQKIRDFDNTRCNNSRCLNPEGVLLVLDHSHETGFIRGWLCAPCNKLEGFAKSSIQCLQGMVEYLQKHGVRK